MQLVLQVYLTTLKTYGWRYIQWCYRTGSGAKSADGGVSGSNGGAWDFALTGSGDMVGIDGVSWGAGYGEVEAGQQVKTAATDERKMTNI